MADREMTESAETETSVVEEPVRLGDAVPTSLCNLPHFGFSSPFDRFPLA